MKNVEKMFILDLSRRTEMKRRLLLQLAVLLVSLGGVCAGDFEDKINEKRWIREYYNEVIQKRDRHVLLEYVPLIKEEPYYIDYSPDGETTVYWYDDFPRRFDKVSCSTEPAIGGLECMNIIRIWGKLEYLKVNKLNPNLYEIWIKDIGISRYSYERELKYGHNLEFALSETEYPLYFKFDGEYLFIYLKDQKTLLSTYCAYDETEYQALVEAIAANVFDMSKFTFPRHADGSCDYEDSTTASETTGIEEAADAPTTERADFAEETAIPKPAPAMGKTAVVTENLRLRTDSNTTAEVVATLAAGTCVKVEITGKEEIIDGITSNWVQVSVLDGAKDKDGNAVETGTKGWLFGGYLSEAEDAKQNAALPILPIAAGVAALAVLLAVVLLAVKKRNNEKGVK